ncbi:hypothetical protein GUJ93_ZPchr0014g47341 [Zizania palustris]|uniref:Uncharacterized protein n=1 Tax=Zizania palustris TaxID=103762 RepID=A0A8J5SW59_ZIZPA|nr:hypothetical protein GUJ93_ZPchr0014g47341 [Zizania palustris]
MLNKPIEHYHAMATIFGNCLATGKYAKATSDSLQIEATEIQDDPTEVNNGAAEANTSGNAAESSRSKPPQAKRARTCDADDDRMIPLITKSLDRLAAAIEKSSDSSAFATEILEDLWDNLSSLPGFEQEHLAHYYAYLCENVCIAKAFLNLDLTAKIVWVTTYISNHFK